MRYARLLIGIALGAAIAYLFDPVSGRGRRSRLQDQAASRARKTSREVRQRAQYEAGRVQGLTHAVRGNTPVDLDAATLLQKIRSEAVGPSEAGTGAIDVDLADGVVVLRGTERDPAAIRDLVRRVERVPGVERVRNEISTG